MSTLKISYVKFVLNHIVCRFWEDNTLFSSAIILLSNYLADKLLGRVCFQPIFCTFCLSEQSFVCKLQNGLGKIIRAKTSNKFNCSSRFRLNSLKQLVDKLCTYVKSIPGILQLSGIKKTICDAKNYQKIIRAKNSNKLNCSSIFTLNSLKEVVDKLCTQMSNLFQDFWSYQE